jgi:hypothetical protein
MLAVGVTIAMAIATATASTLAAAFTRAATPCTHWSRRGDDRLAFLALGDADILGDLVDILGIGHSSLIFPLIHRHGELLLHLLTVYWPRVIAVGYAGFQPAVVSHFERWSRCASWLPPRRASILNSDPRR